MPNPSYTHDLIVIDEASTTTGWAALGGGGAGLFADPDTVIQGGTALHKQVSNARKGQVFDTGAGITLGSDHVFIWMINTTPGLLSSYASGGMNAVIGDSTGAYVEFHVRGNDNYRKGGWINVPIDFVNTAKVSAPNYRTLTGTPGTTPQVFGNTSETTQSVKGLNNVVDAMRYGTGFYLTGGSATNPCTFEGVASVNDGVSAQLGIFTAVDGGFALQGRFVIGQTSAQVASACYFEAGNTLISFTDTPHAATDFTKIIIDHASTVFISENVTLKAIGTVNRGSVEFNNASTSGTVRSWIFDAIASTVLNANVSTKNCTWLGATKLIQNDAVIDSPVINNPDISTGSAFVITSTPQSITNGEFTKGTADGAAIEIRQTGTYTFTGNQFTGYNASTGSNLSGGTGANDAAIYNNSGGQITLNIAGGGDTPSVRNGANASTIVSNPVIFTVTNVEPNSNVVIVQTSGLVELAQVEDSSTTFQYPYEAPASAISATVIVFHLDFVEVRASVTLGTDNQSFQVQQRTDRVYANP